MATLDRLSPVSTPVASAWSPRRAIVMAALLALAIALFQVFQSSNFTSTGQTIHRLQDQKARLAAENKELEAEISELSSLDRIERTARTSLGMAPAISSDYISVAVEAPQGDLLPRPLVQPAPEASASSETPWWQAWLKALPFP